MRRPAVAVLMPFAGGRDAAREAAEAIAELELGDGDEIVVAENSPEPVFANAAADLELSARVVQAGDERGSYYARNAAARATALPWLLFLDADCRPPTDLIDRYFRTPVPDRCGILAGAVEGIAGRGSLVERWSAERGVLRSDRLSEVHPKPFGVTANLLVRREAWEAVGGFQQGIRSTGDAEFCWRVQDAGWELTHAYEAEVEHRHRETLRALGRVSARYGAGRAWVNRHRPGSTPVPRLRDVARSAAAMAYFALTLRFRRAGLKLCDLVATASTAGGYLLSNRPQPPPTSRADSGEASAPPATAVLCDSFPVLAETFIAAEAKTLADLGAPVRVEAVMRPVRPNWDAAAGLDAAWIEDESLAGRVGALLALVARHPIRVARDLATARRSSRDERVPLVSLAPMARRLETWGARHLHAHFATSAAVSAARVASLLGVSHSVTAHAFELFGDPAPLRAKLVGADFVTTGCDYNVRHLRGILGSDPPVHEIVMGVDVDRFKRSSPLPGGRRVIAVGRLVPKKGFADLIEAVALMEGRGEAVDEAVILGEGPLRGELEELARARGVSARVRLPGARDPDAVCAELEGSDLLVMPCVVAPDGDRDSMPVVVKEAMAMEIPVVATDEVGLPELVTPETGRLAPPGDPAAIAQAIAEVLAMPAGRRAEMGRAGRARVAEIADVRVETGKLVRLIESATGARHR